MPEVSLEEQKEVLKNKLSEIENLRSSKTIYMGFYQEPIYGRTVHEFHKFIRNDGPYEKLDVIIESGGGQLDASLKLINILNNYTEEFNILVPFYAKSAATLIALSADHLYIGRAGELGPVDPQVTHPSKNSFLQALSLKDARDFIEQEVTDEMLKRTLSEQLDTYWIGVSQRAIDQSKEYLKDIAERKGLTEGEGGKKVNLSKEFVENYKDHAYPIDRERCREIGVPIEDEDETIEDLLYDIHECAIDAYQNDNLKLLIASSKIVHTEEEVENKKEIAEQLKDLIED